MDYLIQQLINALALGGTYALLALGLAMVFSILGLINFAHGELMTIAGYAVYFTLSGGLPFGAAVVFGVLAAMLAALAMARAVFRPLRGVSVATLLLASFAVSVILRIVFQNAISARDKPIGVPAVLDGTISIGSLQVGVIQGISILTTATLLVALTLFLKRTTLGMSMRAAASDFP